MNASVRRQASRSKLQDTGFKLQIDGISHASFGRFCRRQRVELAVLFGSLARGRQTAHSDLDIAFWVEGTRVERRELGLTNALTCLFHRNDVDVVMLNHASPLLQWQVASTGELLYERRAGGFHRFQLYAMKRYDDSRGLLALQDVFLRRYLRGVRVAW